MFRVLEGSSGSKRSRMVVVEEGRGRTRVDVEPLRGKFSGNNLPSLKSQGGEIKATVWTRRRWLICLYPAFSTILYSVQDSLFKILLLVQKK